MFNNNGLIPSEKDIYQSINNTLPKVAVNPQGSYMRRAAVLLPLLVANGEWHLLFIRRTETVQTHKGQVAFPGGAYEDQDKNLEMTALREACEEIGLQRDDVRMLGRMSDVATVSSYLISPYVCLITWPMQLKLSLVEVSYAFTMPVKWLADSSNWYERTMNIDGKVMDGIVFYQPYEGEILWGVTARITQDLLKIIGCLE